MAPQVKASFPVMVGPGVKPLTSNDRQALAAFLAAPGQPVNVTTYHGLQGFLFAVACSPELILPSTWLSVLMEDDEARYSSAEKARQALDWIVALYNETTVAVADLATAPPLPADCRFRDDVLANLDHDAPISQWSMAFAETHTSLEDSWKKLLPAELEQDFRSAFVTLAFFASRSVAEKVVDNLAQLETTTDPPSLTDLATQMMENFPTAATNYANIGRSIEQLQHSWSASAIKTGRNKPCPCGSGRKYKKCCRRLDTLA